MEGDMPMRRRRGELRDRGYKFGTATGDEKITFSEIEKLNDVNVLIPEKFWGTQSYYISL